MRPQTNLCITKLRPLVFQVSGSFGSGACNHQRPNRHISELTEFTERPTRGCLATRLAAKNMNIPTTIPIQIDEICFRLADPSRCRPSFLGGQRFSSFHGLAKRLVTTLSFGKNHHPTVWLVAPQRIRDHDAPRPNPSSVPGLSPTAGCPKACLRLGRERQAATGRDWGRRHLVQFGIQS